MEDAFPNGRPALEKAGVYVADRDTVNKSERMKVTVCLNPIHTALGSYGCVLDYELFSDVMGDAGLGELIEQMFREEIAGPGAVRKTIKKYLAI